MSLTYDPLEEFLQSHPSPKHDSTSFPGPLFLPNQSTMGASLSFHQSPSLSTAFDEAQHLYPNPTAPSLSSTAQDSLSAPNQSSASSTAFGEARRLHPNPAAPLSSSSDPSSGTAAPNDAQRPLSPSPVAGLPSAGNNTPSASRVPLRKVSASKSNMPSKSGLDIRRSGRSVIPSKRSEQLNKIGDATTSSTVITHPGKENIPPSPTGPPPWISLAKGHLLSRELGEDWVACVDTWFALEEKLGFGDITGTKVSQP